MTKHTAHPDQGCVVVADLGPNPAPLSELIWALYRQRGWAVQAVFVTTYGEGEAYLSGELLRPGAALDQLCDVLPGLSLRAEAVHVERPALDGAWLEDERTEAEALAWAEARWRSAQRGLAEAGERPVVFALIGGRRRSMTAQQAVLFQLLARPQDRCLDVRVSDPRVEGGTGFFFPEQPTQRLRPSGGVEVVARSVEVSLIELPVPRLRALLAPQALVSYQAALAASVGAVAKAAPPQVVLDYRAQAVTVDGALLDLSAAQRIWYAALLTRRAQGLAEGWVRADDLAAIADAVEGFEALARARLRHGRCEALNRLFGDPTLASHWQRRAPLDKLSDQDASALSKLRADTRARLRKLFAAPEDAQRARLLVPEVQHDWVEVAGLGSVKSTAQRVALAPHCIQIVR
jgi:CRISPR-associated protein (TIGR02584 family)